MIKEKAQSFCELVKIALKTYPNSINYLNEKGDSLFYAACSLKVPTSMVLFLLENQAEVEFVSPHTNLNILQTLCLEYDFADAKMRKNQKLIRLIMRHAIKANKIECLMKDFDSHQSPLQILLKQLKNSESQPETPNMRQARLKQEWMFYSCMKILRSAKGTSIALQSFRQYFDEIWREAQPLLSDKSKLMRRKIRGYMTNFLNIIIL